MPALDETLLRHVRASLGPWADAQDGVFTVRQALDAGLTTAHVRTLVRRGTWLPLRRGILCEAVDDPVSVHRLACVAHRLGRKDAVVSHESAWALYRLPLDVLPAQPTLTVPWRSGLASPYGMRMAQLPDAHVWELGSLPLTSGPRTVADVLRTAADRLVAQQRADEAVRAGVERSPVDEVLAWCEGWPGVRQAREAWSWADGRAESPLESRCRVWFRDGGLPVPEAQVTVVLGSGRAARVDFFFQAQRTVVEADGRVKYADPYGGDARTVLWEEKQREDRLRDLGLEVVRATWADGRDGGAELVRRVRRAFERAAQRAA